MIKKIIIPISITIFLCIVVYIALIYISNTVNEKAYNETQKTIAALDLYAKINGSLPPNIDNHLIGEKINRLVKYGPFSTEIKIFEQNGIDHIEYYNFPFGPFTGYNFGTQEWYHTE